MSSWSAFAAFRPPNSIWPSRFRAIDQGRATGEPAPGPELPYLRIAESTPYTSTDNVGHQVIAGLAGPDAEKHRLVDRNDIRREITAGSDLGVGLPGHQPSLQLPTASGVRERSTLPTQFSLHENDATPAQDKWSRQYLRTSRSGIPVGELPSSQ
jgi:hypothetical protein